MKLTYSAAVPGDTILGAINFIPETPEETFLFETLSRNAAVRWSGASSKGGYSIVFEDIYKLRAQGLDPDRPAEKESEYQWRGQGMRKTKPEVSEGWTSYKWHPDQDTEVTMIRKHFIVPKEELEEMRRKVAEIKKNKQS